MLITVLVMAAAVSVEPFRIGMAVLMMTRPRPVLQLLAFLAGGFAMGMTVGLVVLFLLRRVLLGSSYFTVPKVQLLIGVLALLVAAALAVDVPRRLGSRPARTAASMTALHNWIRSRRRPQVAVLLAAAGCVFLTVGVTGL
ncbi:GAP family protein [Mycobacterium avium]|uniref:Uncharacterized protein n=1 Tax=Mycobacterium avium subsp. hominissuis TaxID=439334 RepID=A0A2A3LBQ8_MYCAV|nr:GAP family protein [Mycobacterium avium]PBJ37641.1 hypothetical protein XV03_07265 [Mycobacterium avium subsp. hominissuis]